MGSIYNGLAFPLLCHSLEFTLIPGSSKPLIFSPLGLKDEETNQKENELKEIIKG